MLFYNEGVHMAEQIILEYSNKINNILITIVQKDSQLTRYNDRPACLPHNQNLKV